MPSVELFIYREVDGTTPFLEWFDGQDQRCKDKCFAKLKRLEDEGVDLRRPVADYVDDGIYELRVRTGHVNNRILYFFGGAGVVVLSHGLAKKKRIPPMDIKRAAKRKKLYEQNPVKHSFRWERPK
jgi:hypothetical protein